MEAIRRMEKTKNAYLVTDCVAAASAVRPQIDKSMKLSLQERGQIGSAFLVLANCLSR